MKIHLFEYEVITVSQISLIKSPFSPERASIETSEQIDNGLIKCLNITKSVMWYYRVLLKDNSKYLLKHNRLQLSTTVTDKS